MNIRQAAGLAVVLSSAFLVSACDRNEPATSVGQRVDGAIEQSKDAVQDARQAASAAIDSAGVAASDSAITASVKARLAADDELKMLDISVETTSGRTVLTGRAPNEQARERASRIAEVVDGVTAVDNRLVVSP